MKKGLHTVGVQRQYSGTAGKIENRQLAVHPSYASPFGHSLIDVALYLSRSWAEDPERRAEAGVPDTVNFATKPQLARRLIETAVAGGLPCRWVAGDEAYGGDPNLALALRGHRLGYVLAVACSHRVPTSLVSCAPTRSPPTCRSRHGSGSPRVQARKDTATTTGRSSPCRTPSISTAATAGC